MKLEIEFRDLKNNCYGGKRVFNDVRHFFINDSGDYFFRVFCEISEEYYLKEYKKEVVYKFSIY